MRWIGVAVCVALLCGASSLGTELSPAQASLQQACPGVLFHVTPDGQLTRAFGTQLAYGSSPEEAADAFLLSHSAVFDTVPAELLAGQWERGTYTQPVMPDLATGEFKFTLLYYSQVRDGLPVFRGELRLLAQNVDGHAIVWAGSDLRNLGTFRVPATAVGASAEDAAHAAVQRSIPGLIHFTPAQVNIWAGLGRTPVTPAVALVFEADNGRPATPEYAKWLFVADAANGTILYRENRILHTDVTGNVQGMGTTIPKADDCSPEVAMAMSYAKVALGSTVAYADAAGNFVLPNSGSAPVTVTSYMSGRYFVVDNTAGTEETLTLSVTPPGPANFMHNALNNQEFIRAQVNGYIQSNVVRDFCLTYNPLYPTIYNQFDFPVNVNLNDSCNAYYDYQSINFFRKLGGCNNTAYSDVVHHEYGHHIVDRGGAGQDQYGEGMSDVMGLLIADDPITGYGFYVGQCDTGIRTAVNTYEYPCNGEAHDCGQLLSGCIWSTRNALIVNYPDTYLQILSNLTINSVLLHGPGGDITPDITIDFLTLDDDNGNIYDGTPHYNEICAGFNPHNMDCPALQTGLSVAPSTGFESVGDPGGPFTPESQIYTLRNMGPGVIGFEVTSTQPWLSLSSAAGTLQVDEQFPLTVSVNAYANALPIGVHTDTIHFTNTTNHQGDTTRTVTLRVGTPRKVYDWTLDSSPGWTVAGQWAFGHPTGQGGTEYGFPDPSNGHTGTNVYGVNLNGDYSTSVGGPYNLTTAAFDCTTYSDVTLKFWRWLNTDYQPYVYATLFVSNNGADWTELWSNGDAEITASSWSQHEFDLGPYADYHPTVFVRWGYQVGDYAWAYSGWNIDDIEIWALAPEEYIVGDLNCDGLRNFDDINPFVLALTSREEYEAMYPTCRWMNADCNQDGLVNFDDINYFIPPENW